MRQENLQWKIAALEAKAGLEPRLQRAKRLIAPVASPEEEPSRDILSEIQRLKVQQFRNKIYHAKKEFRKAIKKISTFEMQRLVKKLKQCRFQLEKMRQKFSQEFGIEELNDDVLSSKVPQKLIKAHQKIVSRLHRSEQEILDFKELNVEHVYEKLLFDCLSPSLGQKYQPIQELCSALEQSCSQYSNAIQKPSFALIKESKHFTQLTKPVLATIEFHAQALLSDENLSFEDLQKLKNQVFAETSLINQEEVNQSENEDVDDDKNGEESSEDVHVQQSNTTARTTAKANRPKPSPPSSSPPPTESKSKSKPKTAPIFVESLNAPLSDDSESDTDQTKSQPLTYQYDQSIEYDSDILNSDPNNSSTDYSDSETELQRINAQQLQKKTRKNRLGQQARRKIWEKKYGKGANHIREGKKSTEEIMEVKKREKIRRKYEEKRKLAFEKSRNDSASKFGGDNDNVNEKRSRKDGGVVKGRMEVVEEKLHPSWEAKRKQQQMVLPGQGTKITFGSDSE